MVKKKSVLVVDDHPLIREGLKVIIGRSSKFEVLGEAGAATEGFRMAEQLNPDLMLLDISLPDESGIELTRRIKKALPKVPILILSGINILDKLTGFDREDNDVSRMRKLTQYVRNLATRYKVPIIALMQADASGEGKAWLDQSQLYGSKTGVQGEADAIIMIGNTYELDTRFVHVAKNKLPGGPRTKAAERHGKFEVRFDQEKGRYAYKFY